MKKAKDQPESEPAELASLVGERIRKIRKEEGLSLELFALRCDMNAAYVGHIERGVQNPTLNTLERICKGLDISVEDLFIDMLFTADAAKPMFFSALPYTPHEMESAKHPYELPPVHYTVIRAMGEQMGVGGDDSWGANVHPEYIPDVTKPVEFAFTFRGI